MKEDSTKIVSVGQIDIGLPAERPAPNFDDLPIIAMRDLVLFPGVTFPITLARESSVRTAAAAAERHIPVGIFCQRDSATESPTLDDLYEFGVVADVLKTFDLPDGTHTAILSARDKIKIIGPSEGSMIPARSRPLSNRSTTAHRDRATRNSLPLSTKSARRPSTYSTRATRR